MLYVRRYGETFNLTQKEVENMAAGYSVYNWRDGEIMYGSLSGLIGEPTFQGTIKKNCWVKVKERSRTYHYANGVSTSIDHIEWVWVSSTGTHYLKTNSHIHIVKKDWVRITITE